MNQEKFELEVQPKTPETWRTIKNIVIIGVVYTLHFSGHNGIVNIQSSVNAEAGLGTASLASVYAGFIVSNIFLPTAVIKWLGTKWTMCFTCFAFIPYMLGQLLPSFYIFIPAGFIAGLGAGPLWCAQGTYIANAAAIHQTPSISAKQLVARYLGIFYIIFPTNQIWGNLVSSLVLSSGNNTAATTSVNATMIPILCGANFLPNANAADALPPQPPEKIHLIVGIYLSFIICAIVLVSIGLDAMDRVPNKSQSSQSAFALLAVTLKHCAQPAQLLLIPINIFLGMHQAVFGADFSASFVTCGVGAASVGYALIVYGISNALGCFVTGHLVKLYGRLPLMTCALLLHGSLLITTLVWQPQAGQLYIMLIIGSLWGLSDSVWTVQISGCYGTLFPGKEEAAFSNFRLWESIGFVIMFAMSSYVRTMYKIYFLFSMMVIGMVGYYTVEYQQLKLKKSEEITEKKEEAPMMNDER